MHYIKKGVSLFLATLMTVLAFAANFTFVTQKTEVLAASSNEYGLVDNIQDGTILHCFDWTYNDIKAELKNIAEAGFTSVQTSPAQPGGGSGVWWWLYQPLGFYVGTNDLGTKAELQALCEEAEKYGIKVIVDVVANHLAGEHSSIQNDLKDSQFWHTYGSVSSWADRYQVINGEIGMPDLNSENAYVQQVVKNYINELKGIGVDGIRWDAAKHIGLPSEGCNFWPAVTNAGLYNYGEILRGPDDRESGNEGLMKEYTNYMSVTDSDYGKTLRDSFNSGNAPDSYGNWVARGISNNKLVYWGESHDTWSNNKDWGYSNEMSQNVIDRAYAVAASRSDIAALYFSRPASTVKDNIKAGQKGSTHFTSPEVAAVNHFHNAMVGQTDYYVKSNNCAVVCRTSGAVIVKGSGGSGSVSVTNGGGTTTPGTYKDEITGNEFTVTSTTITGQVGDSGIAVIYNAKPVPTTPTPTISKEGGSFSSETLTLTLGLKNATSGTYKIGSASTETYTGTKTITIGSNMNYGESVTITLTATDGTTSSDPVSYIFTKVEKVVNTAYLKLPSGWSTDVYCYAYDSVTEKVSNSAWPGVKMTLDAATGYYKYEIPENIEKPRVIFNTGVSGANRYPGDREKGLLFETDGSWIYDGSTWSKFTEPVKTGKVTVKYVNESGTQILASKTLTGNVGSAYSTSAEKISGYTLKTTPSNASGTYTASEITVTYVYREQVTPSLAVSLSISSASVYVGDKVTLRASASGGSGSYKYTYTVVDKSTNKSIVLVSQSSSLSYVWTTDSEGSKQLYVTVSDGNGNTASSSYVSLTVSKKTVTEGWKHDSKGWWYQNADGTYPKNTWKKINGKWYHFDANGYMQTGWYKEGTTYYYLKSSGALASDEWVENDKYYIDANGKWVEGKVKVEEGWKHDSKGWWYQNADGTYPKNTWKKINGKWYHLDANGYMQTGWYKEGTAYYYLKSSGALAADEWVEDGKYYIDANGKWVEGKTQATGTWKHDSKGWWYQNADGTYPKDTWQKIDGNWYHFNISGYMQTGWYKEGNVYYYLKSNGVMAAGEWVENGKYYIDSNGYWIK